MKATCLLVGFSFCLFGCTSAHYGLRPAARSDQSLIRFPAGELISATGHLARVVVTADICEVLKSRYMVVGLVFSNYSSQTLQVGYDSVQVACPGERERVLKPLEPETLMRDLSKQRSSRESSRGWGTFLMALAAAHHDPGGHTDLGRVSQTVSSGISANKFQTDQDTEMLREVDRFLLRRSELAPATKTFGLVFFPFSKAGSYKISTQVAQEAEEFDFKLRSY